MDLRRDAGEPPPGQGARAQGAPATAAQPWERGMGEAASPAGPLLFLSHAGADTEAARRLKRRIEAAGLRVWFDKDDLIAGGDWQTQLEDAIKKRATAFAI